MNEIVLDPRVVFFNFVISDLFDHKGLNEREQSYPFLGENRLW
jgi:hypothetical protein